MPDDLQFSSRILDNVHGLIRLTSIEEAIIETPIFRRLLSIKQLSLINRVFPGSEHTRFSHSLGVMHIADKIAVKLNFDSKDRQIIRLAGLLHDIGHYPLSHVCESAYLMDAIPKTTLHDLNVDLQNAIQKFDPYRLDPDKYMNKQDKPHHHENISATVIRNNLDIRGILDRSFGDDFDIMDICDIITGNVERKKDLSLKVQIIHSELDADGLDYLLRDSKLSGTSFGQIELDYLIDNLCIVRYKGQELLAIDPKGIAAADQYLVAKFYAYTRVVYNRRASVIDHIAELITLWGFSKGFHTGVELVKLIEDNSDDFIQFTDDYLWNEFKKYYTEPQIPEFLKVLLGLLINNREPKQQSEFCIISSTPKEVISKMHKSNCYESITTEQYMPLLQYRKMTKHAPSKVIRKWFNQMKKSEEGIPEEEKIYDSEYLDSILLRRYQDAIVVCDKQRKGRKINLLCDDERSLMRHMYKLTCVMLRAYSLPEQRP